MKKILLAAIAVLLLGIGAYFSLQKENTKTTVLGNDTNFSIADTSKIVRFFIAQKNGLNHHFVKEKNGEWRVNEKWWAEKKTVEMVLGTIHEMKIKNPVPKAMRNGVVKELSSKATKVELYDEKGMIKTFYIGESTLDNKGTFIIMDNSETPYIVHIPRHNGYLSDRFKVLRKEWIDKIIFQSNIKNITHLSVEYPNYEEDNFQISKSPSLMVNNLEGELDSIQFMEYLSLYKNIHAEQIVQVYDLEKLEDSLSTVKPFAIIKIEDKIESNSNEVILYNIDSPDRMLGYVKSSNSYVYCQYYNFKPLLVKKGYFKKVKLDL